jgi:hypothetical protein
MSRSKPIEFVELISGFIHRTQLAVAADNKAAYGSAFRAGKGKGEMGRLLINAAIFEGHDLGDEARPRGMFTGTFVCPTIEGSPFMIPQGDLRMFNKDRETTGTSRLTYEGDMAGANGRRLHFFGHKLVDASVSLSLCQMRRSLTNLYVTITKSVAHGTMKTVNHIANEKLAANGILHMRPKDFNSETMALSASGKDVLSKVKNRTNFLAIFASKSMSPFFTATCSP